MSEVVPALRVQNLSRHFGGVAAIDTVSLELKSGETLGVIGPNGAGKSTFINLISGALLPSSGSIDIYGTTVTTLSADARTRLGVGRTHQIPRPFARMTVRENLALAARHARQAPTAQGLRNYCARILERTGLADVADVNAGALPLLRRKRLELARALALQPRLLLLDEIGAGLIAAETQALIALIQALRTEVDAIVLIEHVMDVITACCPRTAVLASGKLLTIGATAEVLRDPQVASVYLGSTAATAARAVTVSAAAQAAAATPPPQPLLELRDVAVNYGGVRALRGVSLQIGPGEALALLGANGAGKTTLARAISGVVPLASGSIHFAGQALAGLPPEAITACGIGHCMEGRRIFASLSVEENLLLAFPGKTAEQQRARLEYIYELFPALRERRHKPGTAMSGGQQQMLAIARALMNQPQLLLFDEISLGLAPIAVEQLYGTLEKIRAAGVAMLVVEQNIERGLQLADRACVLVHGEVRLTGRPDAIRNAPELRALYVGGSAAA
jgi:ABC-type branched-subunit amino acid transport system ATPase component